MVTRHDHIGYFESDIVEPLLPEIPVGFVQDAHVTAHGTTLIRDLASGERNLILGSDDAARELRAGAIVTDGPIIKIAWEDPRVGVVGVTDVTTVPGKRNTLANGFEELSICTASVGVPHIVQHRDGELGRVTCGTGSGEAQHVRGGGAVSGRNPVVVCGVGFQVGELDFVEVLTALGDDDLGTGWGTVIAAREACKCVL